MKKLLTVLLLIITIIQPSRVFAQSQITTADNNISRINTDIANLKNSLNSSTIANLKSKMDAALITKNNAAIPVNERYNEYVAESDNEKAWDTEALNLTTNQSQTAIKTEISNIGTALSNPATVFKIAGVSIVAVGGALVCMATAPVCAAALGYTATAVGTAFTVNGIKVVTTQSNIFGTPVSDSDWARAVLFLPIDVVGTGLSAMELKATLTASLGATKAENLIATATRGMGEEASLAKGEIANVVKASRVVKIGEYIEGVGTVTEKIPGSVTGFTQHGLERLIERGLSQEIVKQAVFKPLVVLKQSGGTMYYLTKDVAVILNETGLVVTTYSKAEFLPKIINLLNRI